MRIVFYGDSITDAGKNRNVENELNNFGMGYGYVLPIACELKYENPDKYEIINSGISGDRIVDLYARVKKDVWNKEPDVLSILCGINDIWHDQYENANGVDIERYEKVYDMLISDTLARFSNLKIMLLEPFVSHGTATDERFDDFERVKDYAKVVKKLAEKYGLCFVPLQDKLDEAIAKSKAKEYLRDGVHPNTAGAMLIAKEWCKIFKEKIDK